MSNFEQFGTVDIVSLFRMLKSSSFLIAKKSGDSKHGDSCARV